jgi:hypothetical protein
MNMANLTSSQIGKLLNHTGPLWLRDLHLSGADLAGLIWTNLSAANLREADRVSPELTGAAMPDGTQRKKPQAKRQLSQRAQPGKK